MENIKGRANSYAQWILRREGCLKSARLPQFLEDMLIEQKAIDDRECETMVGAAAKEVKQVMIDKACKWLKSQANECFVSGDSVGEHLVFKDLSLAEFLKAMEE